MVLKHSSPGAEISDLIAERSSATGDAETFTSRFHSLLELTGRLAEEPQRKLTERQRKSKRRQRKCRANSPAGGA